MRKDRHSTLAAVMTFDRLFDLYQKLSKQHIRELDALIQKTEFRYDVVGNLPAELAQLVAEHLGLACAVQYRRVSRRWYHLFTSESLMRSLTEPWRSAGEFELRIPEGITERAKIDLIAEHEIAFRAGNPFAHASFRIERPQGELEEFAYSEGYLACVMGETISPKIATHHIGRCSWGLHHLTKGFLRSRAH